MTCEKCHAVIPDNLMSCPVCALAQSDAAVREAQGEYLRRVLRGEWAFITCRDTNGTNHLRMFGVNVDRSFCGQTLTIEKRKLGRVEWESKNFDFVCAGCRVEVKRLTEDLT
jgi:hypothetical protein